MITTTKVPSVKQSWRRLERWFHQHLPEVTGALKPGATPRQLVGFERQIGQALPTDVRESFAIHNGQTEKRCSGAIYGLPLLSVSLALKHWKAWRKYESLNDEFRSQMRCYPKGTIQLDYTNASWIPLTFDFSGNHIGVDLAPGPKGCVGQVIIFGRDENIKCVAAKSWREFLDDTARSLERDNFVIGEDRQLEIKDPPVKHFHQAIARRYRSRGV